MDKVYINKLLLETIIGVHDWEKKKKQNLLLSLELTCDTRKAAQTDTLSDTLDYDTLCQRLRTFAHNNCCQLLETLAEQLAEICLNEFKVPSVVLSLSKPGALAHCSDVGVSIVRKNSDCST